MKLGASTLAGINDTLEENLNFIENLGLKYAEIVYQYPHDKIDVEILKSYNLKYSIHSPFMDVNIASLNEKSRLNSVNQIESSIDLANEIDAETVVVHPGLVSFLARIFKDDVYKCAYKSIKEIGKYAKDSGVIAAVENMPDFEAMIYQNIYDLNNLVTSLDMAMTLDIGHAHHVGYSAEEIYFDSIKHIHVHDNCGDDDSHLAFGEGSIKLKDIINNFERKNYDGIYIIEVNNYESIEKSYEFMKNNF